MAREPVYPKDAPIGKGRGVSIDPADSAAAPTTEITAVTAAAGKLEPSRKKQLVTGAAIGIGSAAIVAALLYANRGRRSDKN